MTDTNTGDMALILAFVFLPLIMINALFVFIITLIGGKTWILYTILGVLDLLVIGYIINRTEVGQVIKFRLSTN